MVVLAGSPTNVDAVLALSHILKSESQLDGAIEVLEIYAEHCATEKEFMAAKAHAQLAELYLQSGRRYCFFATVRALLLQEVQPKVTEPDDGAALVSVRSDIRAFFSHATFQLAEVHANLGDDLFSEVLLSTLGLLVADGELRTCLAVLDAVSSFAKPSLARKSAYVSMLRIGLEMYFDKEEQAKETARALCTLLPYHLSAVNLFSRALSTSQASLFNLARKVCMRSLHDV